MSSPDRGALRLLRAGALGFTCLALGLVGHLAAGGPRPSVAAAVLTAVPLTGLAVLLTGRRCRFGTVAAFMTASQVLLHEAFMWLTAAPVCAAPSGAMTSHLTHLTHGGATALLTNCPPSAAPMSAAGHAMGGLTPAMLAAHLVAGLAATVLLTHGERLVWRLEAWLTRRTLLGLRSAVPVVRRVRNLVRTAVVVRMTAAATDTLSRRGPPSALAFPG